MTEENTKYPLIRRLRTMAAIGWNPIGDEAADEIERLQTKVNTLEDALRCCSGTAYTDYLCKSNLHKE